MELIKTTKAEFFRYAEQNGIAYCGSAGVNLERAIEIMSQNADFVPTRRDKVARTSDGFRRHYVTESGEQRTSGLHLGKYDTVYRFGDFWLVYTFTEKDSRCSFDSFNSVFYK